VFRDERRQLTGPKRLLATMNPRPLEFLANLTQIATRAQQHNQTGTPLVLK
jgi:hypothetical protein